MKRSAGFLCCVVLAAAACVESSEGVHERRVIDLEATQQFGSDSIAPGDATGGAVLGGIYDADVGPDSRLYVLESDWKKIVVFEPDGRVSRIIMGGHGEGPGEFVRAVALDVDSRGHAYVLDVGSARISVFDSTGRYLDQFPISAPARDLAVLGDTVFLRVLFGGDPHAVRAIVRGRSEPVPLVSTNERDRAFSLAGFSGAIASGAAGRVVYAFGSPGEFVVIDGAGVSDRRGAPLFPDVRPTIVDAPTGPQRRVAVGTLGVAVVPPDVVAILFARYDVEDPTRVSHHVAFFSIDGTFLGVHDIEEPTRVIAAGPRPDVLYLNRSLPFPMMVEQRLGVGAGGE